MTYMRFITTDSRPLTFEDLRAGIAAVLPEATLRLSETGDYGDIELDGDPYAEVEINHPGDEIFGEDLDDLREPVEWFSDTPQKQRVLSTLDQARQMVSLRLTRAGWESDVMDRLCDWLLDARDGLLQIDGQGYYDRGEQVLKM